MLYQHCKEKLPKIAKNSPKGQKSAKNSQKSWQKINQEQFKLCFTRIIKKILIFQATDYGHTKAKSLILCGPNSNPNPK